MKPTQCLISPRLVPFIIIKGWDTKRCSLDKRIPLTFARDLVSVQVDVLDRTKRLEYLAEIVVGQIEVQ